MLDDTATVDGQLDVSDKIVTQNIDVSGVATISQLDLNDLELNDLKVTGISSLGNVEIQKTIQYQQSLEQVI